MKWFGVWLAKGYHPIIFRHRFESCATFCLSQIGLDIIIIYRQVSIVMVFAQYFTFYFSNCDLWFKMWLVVSMTSDFGHHKCHIQNEIRSNSFLSLSHSLPVSLFCELKRTNFVQHFQSKIYEFRFSGSCLINSIPFGLGHIIKAYSSQTVEKFDNLYNNITEFIVCQQSNQHEMRTQN